MRSSVFWALVRKDVYLMRGFMIATGVVGLVSLVLMTFGGAVFAVGGILFLTANVAGAIFIAMYSLFGSAGSLASVRIEPADLGLLSTT
jgi:hypothetical protein